MGKKHKAKLKEIERLRALYQEGSESNIYSEVQTTSTPVVDQSQAKEPVAAVSEHKHIQKDLIFLVVLIVLMLAVLVGLNWAVSNTSFADWLVNLFGI